MTIATYLELADRIRTLPARAGATRVIAVDGPAGSGKSAFAAKVAAALEAPMVHLDDLCPGWEGMRRAAPRLVQWVLQPLATGTPARYRRYDWERDRDAEWHEVPERPILIVEGVTSGSKAVSPYLSFLIWVTAPREVRLARGIARDGEAYRSRWEAWSLEEDESFSTDATRERADLRVDGSPTLPHDPEREFVVIR